MVAEISRDIKLKKFMIPFSGRSHEYTKDERALVDHVMTTASPLTQGEYLRQLELDFADFVGVNCSFAVSSATSGLELAAQLCQFRVGDEVIVPAHTFTSSAYPFAKHGGRLVWADIDLYTRVVDAEQIEKCISPHTKAVVVPHLYGYVADMPDIMALCRQHNIVVIEDVAQAIGASIDGQIAGSFGDIGIFSLHAQKNISSLGEGGVIVTRDDRFAKVLPMLRHNGHCDFEYSRTDYWLPAMGNVDMPEMNGVSLWPNNYCLGEVTCALASRLLDRVTQINDEKRTRAIKFIDGLTNYQALEFHRETTTRHNYHLLVARLTKGSRDDFIREMATSYGIQCAVQYYPLYRYPLYKKLGLSEASCPNTDLLFDNMISFPFSHALTDEQIDFISESISKVMEFIA